MNLLFSLFFFFSFSPFPFDHEAVAAHADIYKGGSPFFLFPLSSFSAFSFLRDACCIVRVQRSQSREREREGTRRRDGCFPPLSLYCFWPRHSMHSRVLIHHVSKEIFRPLLSSSLALVCPSLALGSSSPADFLPN